MLAIIPIIVALHSIFAVSSFALTVDESSHSFDSSSGGNRVNVTSTTTWSWSITGNSGSWVTTSEPNPQTGNQGFSYGVAANTSASSRSATITFSASGLPSVTHVVNQAGAAGSLSINETSRSFDSTSGGNSVNVTSNTTWSWSITGNAGGWVTTSESTSQTGTQLFTYGVAANTSTSSRSATITFSASGLPSVTHSINQAGAASNLSINDVSRSFDITSGGNSVNVTSNTTWSWSITGNAGGWVTTSEPSSQTGTQLFTYGVTANTSTSSRSATITFSASGLPSVTHSINQAGAASNLSINDVSRSFDSTSGGNSVNVTSNTTWSWSITGNAGGWVTTSESTSQTGTQLFTYGVAANTSTSSRSATITFSASGLPSVTHSITQAGGSPANLPPTVGSFTAVMRGDGRLDFNFTATDPNGIGYVGVYIVNGNETLASFTAASEVPYSSGIASGVGQTRQPWTAEQLRGWLTPGTSYKLRMKAEDGLGAGTGWFYSPPFTYTPIQPQKFTIEFDYRYDTNGFFSGANIHRRLVLEAAADVFEARLMDQLGAISPLDVNPNSADSWITDCDHPSNGSALNLEDMYIPKNTLIVFPGAFDVAEPFIAKGSKGHQLVNGFSIGSRGGGPSFGAGANDFSGWGGSIYFDTSDSWHSDMSSSEVPSGSYDLYSVAVHELGHILGISRGVPAWDNLMVDLPFNPLDPFNTDKRYVGGRGNLISSNLFIKGGIKGGSHFTDGTAGVVEDSGVTQTALMADSIVPGVRRYFTNIDFAALDDLGWDVLWPTKPDTSAARRAKQKQITATIRAIHAAKKANNRRALKALNRKLKALRTQLARL